MSDIKTIKPLDLSRMDFVTDQSVKWCPGCGDYSILKQAQRVMPELGVPREKFLFISGIGCSSRFPYYMNTYGFHTIHGRAAAIASGAKLANPDLSVWVVTGDGDGLSIGGNHTIHLLRRNLDINILLFNNRIYGLTKGQYSPTSELGKVTKSTPLGSLDRPFNPTSLALGSQATFVARTIDRSPKHIQDVLKSAYEHKGTSFIEIYQNCNIFNDGAYENLTDKAVAPDNVIQLENGKPMIFGKNNNLGIHLDCNTPKIINLDEDDNVSIDDVLVHDEKDIVIASMLSSLTYDDNFPTPIGIIYAIDAPIYENLLQDQINSAIDKQGKGDMDSLLNSGNTWEVK
ncbi:2-oxoacid:ferredoxin oxidoreductase subunit beta [Candidatus Neomarinimicrobiota bacterium]